MALEVRPLFLLLPGTLCNASLFNPLRRVLDVFGKCVDIDYAGANSVEAMAAVALQLADSRNEAAPLIPVGVSMGGIVALEIMRIASTRVSGLVLFATNADADTP